MNKSANRPANYGFQQKPKALEPLGPNGGDGQTRTGVHGFAGRLNLKSINHFDANRVKPAPNENKGLDRARQTAVEELRGVARDLVRGRGPYRSTPERLLEERQEASARLMRLAQRIERGEP